jgi:homoserine kinase type II
MFEHRTGVSYDSCADIAPLRTGMHYEREKFTQEELAECLGHYDLGKVRHVREFARGSRKSPKAILDTEKGKFLFKRRAVGKDDLQKVAFTHEIQSALAVRNFPLPKLLRTRDDGRTMLVLGWNVYEMFEYIDGGNFDGSREAAFSAGRTLGLYHKLLLDFRSEYAPPTGSYHDAQSIHRAIRDTVSSLPMEMRPPADVLLGTVQNLEQTYRHCCEQTNSIGLGDWDSQIVHGDWHPGNMLFREHHVAAVIDYDAARRQQRVIDLANGALQFSILGGSKDPARWPERLDENRFREFVRGYDTVNIVSVAELKVLPYLMCEAMIAEAVLPIAATGSFGRMEGFPFLQMVDRKIRWILGHLSELCAVLTR